MFLGVSENDELFRAIDEKCRFEKLSVEKRYDPEVEKQEFNPGFTMFRKGTCMIKYTYQSQYISVSELANSFS